MEGRPIEIIAAELPGRDSRTGETPCGDLDRIVGGFADLLEPLAAGPFAFFGHSLGAILAFEVTRRIRDRGGRLPAHLFVSGAYAPQLPRTLTPLRFIEGDAAFLEAVAAEYGGVPKIVLEQTDLRLSIVPALRADIALTETYRVSARRRRSIARSRRMQATAIRSCRPNASVRGASRRRLSSRAACSRGTTSI